MPVPTTPSRTPAFSPLTPDFSDRSHSRHDTAALPSEPVPSGSINLDHLELLHHFENVTYQSFKVDENVAIKYRETAVTTALRFPFLMYAILAFAAMHLSRIRPDRSAHYHALASSLQAIGLTGLDDTLLNINKDNCVALFLFSSMTGIHSFCDTFTFRGHNFNDFLDKFTSTIDLMRGVRSVMDGGWWEYLQTTSLADLLAVGSFLGDSNIDKSKETRPLWDLLSVADMGAASLETCRDSVLQLQRVFRAQTLIQHTEASLSMIFTWPIVVNDDYNKLLQQRRPEALIILAYYGVLLHERREAWAVGDAGKFLIQSIIEYLGRHWERWLEWPRDMISATPMHSAAHTPAGNFV